MGVGTGEDRGNLHASQLDLFAWGAGDGNSIETEGQGGTALNSPGPMRGRDLDVAAMTREALLGALETYLDPPKKGSFYFSASAGAGDTSHEEARRSDR